MKAKAIAIICQAIIVICAIVILGISKEKQLKEYQIQLDFNTVKIYQKNRFVGSYVITEPLSPIDSILALDNQ